jgi:hypothetical protein
MPARRAAAPEMGDMPSVAEFIGDYNDPKSIGSRMRRRRAKPLLDMIESIYVERGRCSILDLGGTEKYWNTIAYEFLAERNCRITLLNRTAPELRNRELFTAMMGDGCAVDARDNSFDIVHSNSVVEHVGDWQRTQAFSREVRRLARRYFVQTPNFWFPWEPHFGLPFFQYLPLPLRARMLMRRNLGFFERCPSASAALEAVDSIQLLDAMMMRALFPDARLMRERIMGLTKSLIAVRE